MLFIVLQRSIFFLKLIIILILWITWISITVEVQQPLHIDVLLCTSPDQGCMFINAKFWCFARILVIANTLSNTMTFETSILEFTLKQHVYVHVLSSSFQKSVLFIPRKIRGGIAFKDGIWWTLHFCDVFYIYLEYWS